MDRVALVVARVLGISSETITDETSPDTVESWDSYNALMLVSELEEEFKVQFSMDEVMAVKCVGDIKAALVRHGVAL